MDFNSENYSKLPMRAAKTHNAYLQASKHLKKAFHARKLAPQVGRSECR